MKQDDLTQYYINLDLIQKTAAQIAKDFNLVNEKIIFSGNAENAYNELLSQIEPVVSALIHKDYFRLINLLYRIDVSEKQAIIAMRGKNNAVVRAIARLIIKRELQKVVTKSFFSGK